MIYIRCGAMKMEQGKTPILTKLINLKKPDTGFFYNFKTK